MWELLQWTSFLFLFVIYKTFLLISDTTKRVCLHLILDAPTDKSHFTSCALRTKVMSANITSALSTSDA